MQPPETTRKGIPWPLIALVILGVVVAAILIRVAYDGWRHALGLSGYEPFPMPVVWLLTLLATAAVVIWPAVCYLIARWLQGRRA